MEDGIFFNQSKYIKKMLKKFWLEDSKTTKTPMSMEIKLTKDGEADSVDSTKYRGMSGSLLYITNSYEYSGQGFAAVLAVLVTGESQSIQHGKSE
ncbi:hypothetical protein Tco_0855467 [Tanacetum coccineum]